MDLNDFHFDEAVSRFPKDKQKIILLLNQIFPKIISKVNIGVVSAEIINKGNVNVCILIKNTSHKKYVLRICSNDKLFIDDFWRKKLSENHICVPEEIFHDYSKKDIPFMYEVIGFIDGVNPDTLQSPEIQYRGAWLAGRELRKLHNIPVLGFESITPGGEWTKKRWIDALENYLSINRHHKYALEIFTENEINLIYDYVLRDKMMDITNPKLIHGDVGHNNIIYRQNDERIYILDPGTLIGGDPIFDLAYAGMPDEKGLFFKGIMDGYQSDKKLTDDQLYRYKRLRLASLVSNALRLHMMKVKSNPFITPAKDIMQKI